MVTQRLGVDYSPVFADEEFLCILMANESMLEVDAFRIGVMHGEAIISRLPDIFEDDIERGVRQVMLHETFTADRFLDYPRRTFAVPRSEGADDTLYAATAGSIIGAVIPVDSELIQVKRKRPLWG